LPPGEVVYGGEDNELEVVISDGARMAGLEGPFPFPFLQPPFVFPSFIFPLLLPPSPLISMEIMVVAGLSPPPSLLSTLPTASTGEHVGGSGASSYGGLRRKMYDTKCIMSIEKKIIINRG
jgi:hypothetical protein